MSNTPESKADPNVATRMPLALTPVAAALKPAGPRAPAMAPQGPAMTPPAIAETGGPKGPEPTRFGDWERKGRVSDF